MAAREELSPTAARILIHTSFSGYQECEPLMAASHIVVADDEEPIRSFVAEVLEEAGYVVQALGDGASALAAIRARPPALALLDVAMPVMMGDEALRQLRADGLLLPIIIMTAGTNPHRFLQDGATAVLPKPFDLDTLLALIAEKLAPPRERHYGE